MMKDLCVHCLLGPRIRSTYLALLLGSGVMGWSAAVAGAAAGKVPGAHAASLAGERGSWREVKAVMPLKEALQHSALSLDSSSTASQVAPLQPRTRAQWNFASSKLLGKHETH